MLWPWNWVIIKHFSAGQNDHFHIKRMENVMNTRRELVALRHSTGWFWTNLSCLLCRQACCHALTLSPGLLPSLCMCARDILSDHVLIWGSLQWSGFAFPFIPVTWARDASLPLQRSLVGVKSCYIAVAILECTHIPHTITHSEAAKFKQISQLISTGTVANSPCYLWLTCKQRFGKSW